MTSNKQRQSEWRERRRALLDAAKAVPCADCGEEHPPFVMDLDHVRGKKIKNVSRMMSDGAPWKSVLEEIAKCDVVCANCHRYRTHKKPRRGGRA